jgi:hypothetical protein
MEFRLDLNHVRSERHQNDKYRVTVESASLGKRFGCSMVSEIGSRASYTEALSLVFTVSTLWAITIVSVLR